jgi:hypothetical protein
MRLIKSSWVMPSGWTNACNASRSIGKCISSKMALRRSFGTPTRLRTDSTYCLSYISFTSFDRETSAEAANLPGGVELPNLAENRLVAL